MTGLSCTAWRRKWWQRIPPERVVVGIVGGCVIVAFAVLGSVAESLLAGAGAMLCCVPMADGFGGGG